MREQARYIDEGIVHLSEIASSRHFGGIRFDDNIDFLEYIDERINSESKEIEKIAKNVEKLSNLSVQIKEIEKAMDEIKRYGVFCGMPLGGTSNVDKKIENFDKSPSIKTPLKSPIIEKSIIAKTKIAEYTEVDSNEYESLPNIIRLLVKIEDLNKHYKTLFNMYNQKFTMNDVSNVIPLAGSRLEALMKALASLKRVDNNEERTFIFL